MGRRQSGDQRSLEMSTPVANRSFVAGASFSAESRSCADSHKRGVAVASQPALDVSS